MADDHPLGVAYVENAYRLVYLLSRFPVVLADLPLELQEIIDTPAARHQSLSALLGSNIDRTVADQVTRLTFSEAHARGAQLGYLTPSTRAYGTNGTFRLQRNAAADGAIASAGALVKRLQDDSMPFAETAQRLSDQSDDFFKELRAMYKEQLPVEVERWLATADTPPDAEKLRRLWNEWVYGGAPDAPRRRTAG